MSHFGSVPKIVDKGCVDLICRAKPNHCLIGFFGMLNPDRYKIDALGFIFDEVPDAKNADSILSTES